MKSNIFLRGISNPLALILLFFGPLVIKWFLTGHFGVPFQFYFVFFWIPVLSLVYGIRFGWRMVAATIIIFAIATGFIYLNYPDNPPMIFQRQVLHEGTPIFAIAFAMCFLGQIAFRVSRESTK